MKLARWIVAHCPPAERAVRTALNVAGATAIGAAGAIGALVPAALLAACVWGFVVVVRVAGHAAVWLGWI